MNKHKKKSASKLCKTYGIKLSLVEKAVKKRRNKGKIKRKAQWPVGEIFSVMFSGKEKQEKQLVYWYLQVVC
ncbi:MAG TPA: hypothetical protein H9740_06805 [Candidatus Hungatella pullicola]|nr:hypothetical protein [Candidatus Hungatella pullicola]